ncbi:cappuccino [Carabus blaptoides fortunei]
MIKAKNVKKNSKRFGRNKRDDRCTGEPDEFEDVCAGDVGGTSEYEDNNDGLTITVDTSKIAPSKHDETKTANKIDCNLMVTDSWKKVNKLNKNNKLLTTGEQQVTPPSGESSSDSVFTDPLTPVDFAAEFNQCYCSEESVNIEVEVPDLTSTNYDVSVWPFNDITLNSFKLNEYKLRKELELNEKLAKLVISKTSQINLCENDGSFNTLNASSDHETNSKNDLNREDSYKAANKMSHRPRKIELVAARLTPESDGQLGQVEYKRHLSMSDANCNAGEESTILRKVTSLILDRSTLENRIVKPKFVPEKLDFKIYEKFEGHMLVNWVLSEFSDDHYLRTLLTGQDLRLLATQFCTHLLVAGVLCQVPDKDVPMESVFRMDLMYYWAHMEAPASVPQTPGKLTTVSWPPTNSTDPLPSDPYSPNELKSPLATKINGDLILSSQSKDCIIKKLEKNIMKLEKELEKYQKLTNVQALPESVMNDFSKESENNNNISPSKPFAISNSLPAMTVAAITTQELTKTMSLYSDIKRTVYTMPKTTLKESPSLSKKLVATISQKSVDTTVQSNAESTNEGTKTISATSLQVGKNDLLLENTNSQSRKDNKTPSPATKKISPTEEQSKICQSNLTENKICPEKKLSPTEKKSQKSLSPSSSPLTTAFPSNPLTCTVPPPLPTSLSEIEPAKQSVLPPASPISRTTAPPPPPMPCDIAPVPFMQGTHGSNTPANAWHGSTTPTNAGMGPPPPQMPGMGPPPPQIPGMGPPPPPMPGMGPPPPPMLGMGPPPRQCEAWVHHLHQCQALVHHPANARNGSTSSSYARCQTTTATLSNNWEF